MTSSHSDKHDGEDPVETLVFETLERMESEGSAAIESAASKHPELELELRARLEALQAMGLVDTPPGAPITLPEQVGSFVLGKALGEGGMGLVFEAHDPSINRKVAIKLIRPQYVSRESIRERFAREGQAIARLQHPAVGRVYQVGEEEDLPFIVMERVFGCTLAEVLDAIHAELDFPGPSERTGLDFLQVVQRLAPGDELREAGPHANDLDSPSRAASELYTGTWGEVVAKICREVAEGLAHAHSAGVLHRDVKASNVMVTPEGRVVLIDFGLAQLDTAATMTAAGSRIGSLPYTAPERIAAGSKPTELADVYSLGVVMYELLTLGLPFRAANEAGLIRLIAQGKAPAIQPAIRVGFADVTERAMRRDPLRRPPTAAAFAEDLSRVLAGKAPIAYGDGPWAALRSRWRARPFVTAAILAATLLAVLLPTTILSMRARAAERVAESGEISLLRLQLALQATASLQNALPDSPAIDGTPLENLRAVVLKDLAGIEARVAAEHGRGSGLGESLQSEGFSPVPIPADRALITRARKVVAQGFRGADGEATTLDAVKLVNELDSVRGQTSRSLDVDAALIELMQALAIHAGTQGDGEAVERWGTKALRLSEELLRTLPQSTWLKSRAVELSALVSARNESKSQQGGSQQ